MVVAGYGLRVAGCGLRVAGYQPSPRTFAKATVLGELRLARQGSGYSPFTVYRLPFTVYRLPLLSYMSKYFFVQVFWFKGFQNVVIDEDILDLILAFRHYCGCQCYDRDISEFFVF